MNNQGPVEGVYIYNSGISSGIPVPPGEATNSENGDQFDGAVIDESGDIDVYTNVDYFIGTRADDTVKDLNLINLMLCGLKMTVIPLMVEPVMTH